MVTVLPQFKFAPMGKVVLIGLWLMSSARAQWGNSNMLAGASGLSGYENIFWGTTAYPAAMQSNAPGVGFFGEKRYLTNLTYFELAFAANVSAQPFMVLLIREGNIDYTIINASFAMSKKISERLNISIRPGYAFSTISGYGSRGQPMADIGLIFRINSKLKWGIQTEGLSSFFVKSPVRNLVVRSGIGYMVSDMAFLSLEMVKEQGQPVYTMGGLQYAFHEQMNARFGYIFQLSTASFALGYLLGGMDLSLSLLYHLNLGASAGISITRKFKKDR